MKYLAALLLLFSVQANASDLSIKHAYCRGQALIAFDIWTQAEQGKNMHEILTDLAIKQGLSLEEFAIPLKVVIEFSKKGYTKPEASVWLYQKCMMNHTENRSSSTLRATA